MGSEFQVRAASAAERSFLADMLVEAVNWRDQRHLSREQLLADPALARYVEDWPRPGELGLVAEAEGELIGAAWLRFFASADPGYGYIAEDVPELSMAVVAAWRGRGVGRALLRETARRARRAGISEISLSVERGNLAHELYVSEGYRVVGQHRHADTMLLDLRAMLTDE